MNIQDILISQYHAAMEMLRRAVAACPADLWDVAPGAVNAGDAARGAAASKAAETSPATSGHEMPGADEPRLAPPSAKPFWRVAYHTLWFTDLYLSPSEAEFAPWPKHEGEPQFFGPLPWDGNRLPRVGPTRSPAELLEFADWVAAGVAQRVAATDLAGPSGFWWLSFTRLELHIYNIRHVQHHAATLIARLRERAGVEIDWVARGPIET